MFVVGRGKDVAILKLFCGYCRNQQRYKYFDLDRGFRTITM